MRKHYYFYKKFSTDIFDLICGIELELNNPSYYAIAFIDLQEPSALNNVYFYQNEFAQKNDLSQLGNSEIIFLKRYSEKIFNQFALDLQNYLEGDYLAFNNWPLKESIMTSFAREVFNLIRDDEILNGIHLWSYSEIASWLGKPHAARAVGQVMAKNPFPLILPCHRVVPKSGGLGNYGPGPALKKAMLEHESLW